ncbi:0a08f9ca-549c-4257-a346-5db951c0886f [Thermothielavioides terrestris]|uniref:ER membrane protein complex subunit 10 n=2 Tax=Thermothielavioides terrestris TaxID=2587410 RepID=G2RFR4_THETT|nr:uncharacterized protein THITE_2124356 [Thermothielavioides terrestris NRRL 8126]AEO71668.1 hypothetical protein THITE_2124356 [Thermothielavioides terrestris NRRL 8126]SPQ27345.1 0a08f9ca-549c-4257-a346-5db951c0886f [Thermothielavioides terrestris]
MRLPTLISALLASSATTTLASAASARTVAIYIQPVAASPGSTEAPPPPSFLAELALPDLPSPTEGEGDATIPCEVLAYEAPDLDLDAGAYADAGADQQQQPHQLFRTGVYDPAARRWLSPTTAASARNFAKGYAPRFELGLDGDGHVLGATVRGVAIDAGYTRDFGPRAAAVVRAARPGPQPVLGKPVVLSPEGRKVVVEERTFLQKYWWALAIGAFLLLSGGGGEQSSS